MTTEPDREPTSGARRRSTWRCLLYGGLGLVVFAVGMWRAMEPKVDPRLVGLWEIKAPQTLSKDGVMWIEFSDDGLAFGRDLMEPDSADLITWGVRGDVLIIRDFADENSPTASQQLQIAWQELQALRVPTFGAQYYRVKCPDRDTLLVDESKSDGESLVLRRVTMERRREVREAQKKKWSELPPR